MITTLENGYTNSMTKGIDGIISRKHVRHAFKITDDVERKKDCRDSL
jgi:hypothetical protein